MVGPAFNPSTWEAEADFHVFQGQCGLQSKFQSSRGYIEKGKKKKKEKEKERRREEEKEERRKKRKIRRGGRRGEGRPKIPKLDFHI